MTEQSNEPSQTIQDISGALGAPPSIAEVDAHIGSLARELARFKGAFSSLLAYAHGLEQEAVTFSHQLYAKETQLIGAKRTAQELEAQLTEAKAHLEDLIGHQPATESPATTPEAPVA